MSTLTLDGFIQATLEIVEEDGIAEYLPVIVPLGEEEFQVIDGIPEDVDHRDAIQDVIEQEGLNNTEFYFCVRSSSNELTGGHYTPSGAQFFSIRESAEGLSVSRAASCGWWRVRPGEEGFFQSVS